MYIIRCICLWMILGLMACSGPVRIQKNLEVKPEIFPDYADVTIPPNIAPLNFKLKDACAEARAILECGPEKLEIKTGKDACFVIPASGWKRLLRAASGNHLNVIRTSLRERMDRVAPFTIRWRRSRSMVGWLTV